LGKVLNITVNQPIPAEEFEIEFPPGTFVIDRRSRGDEGKPSHYIVKSSGNQMISQEELVAKTYPELNQEQVTKTYPELNRAPGFNWRWVLVLALAAVALLAIAFVYYRKG